MKKIVLIAVLMALTGCEYRGHELICSTKGELFYQEEGASNSISADGPQDLHNKRQLCINQPDGSILIKNVDKDND